MAAKERFRLKLPNGTIVATDSPQEALSYKMNRDATEMRSSEDVGDAIDAAKKESAKEAQKAAAPKATAAPAK